MKKAAFAAVAVLAVVALFGSNLLSQAPRQDVHEEVRETPAAFARFPGAGQQTAAVVDRDRLVAEYVRLTQRLANEMSVNELENEVVRAQQELARKEREDAVFAPIINELRLIAEKNKGRRVGHKALAAAQILQSRGTLPAPDVQEEKRDR